MLTVISKAAAKASGLKRYFTGKPCRKGHVVERDISGRCLTCRLQQEQAWVAANRERRQATQKAWLEANPERQKKNISDWRKRNAARVAETDEAYRNANRAKMADASARWKKKKPERLRLYAHNRRARKAQMEDALSVGLVARLWREQGASCACPCRKPLRLGYHLDHILSLKRGGRNVDENIQLLTPKCNLRKSTKDNAKFMAQQAKRYRKNNANS